MAARVVSHAPAAGAAGLAAVNAYLLALLGAATRGRRPPAPATAGRLEFAVVIPARDEEGAIEEALASLDAVDYPRERVERIVVADNCSDATAETAARAGATVWARSDDAAGGKGAALEWALG